MPPPPHRPKEIALSFLRGRSVRQRVDRRTEVQTNYFWGIKQDLDANIARLKTQVVTIIYLRQCPDVFSQTEVLSIELEVFFKETGRHVYWEVFGDRKVAVAC